MRGLVYIARRFRCRAQDEYFRRADVWPLNPEGELIAILMVESAEGVKNLNQILDVPGVGGIFIGANDLSVSLGVGPRPTNGDLAPESEAAIQTILKGCQAKKVICGYGAARDKAEADRRVAQGFRILVGGGR